MSNNPLQREYFPGVEEVNEEAARQAAGEAEERALSLRPQSPVPDLDPAAADVQMGGMDNDDMPAQGGAEDPAQGAKEQAQDGPHAPEVPRAEQGRGGTNEGTRSPEGRTGAEAPAIDALLGLRHTGIEAVRRDIGATMEATAVSLPKHSTPGKSPTSAWRIQPALHVLCSSWPARGRITLIESDETREGGPEGGPEGGIGAAVSNK